MAKKDGRTENHDVGWCRKRALQGEIIAMLYPQQECCMWNYCVSNAIDFILRLLLVLFVHTGGG